jgi:hypothetical protein
MLVKGVPGFNDPVRAGDLYKRMQGDYTRKTQAAEKLKTQYETEHKTRQGEIATERQRLEQIASSLLSRQQSSAQPTADQQFLDGLKSAEYIDGPTMSKFAQTMQDKGFTPIVKAFQERDQILQSMAQQLITLNQHVQQMQSKTGTQDLDSKIAKYVTDLGYPTDANRYAKEIYAAYEGDDLETEFPEMLRERMDGLSNMFRNVDRQRIDAARRPSVPGKGGSGTTGKTIGLKGTESAKETADMLWEAMQTHENT